MVAGSCTIVAGSGAVVSLERTKPYDVVALLAPLDTVTKSSIGPSFNDDASMGPTATVPFAIATPEAVTVFVPSVKVTSNVSPGDTSGPKATSISTEVALAALITFAGFRCRSSSIPAESGAAMPPETLSPPPLPPQAVSNVNTVASNKKNTLPVCVRVFVMT